MAPSVVRDWELCDSILVVRPVDGTLDTYCEVLHSSLPSCGRICWEDEHGVLYWFVLVCSVVAVLQILF